MGGIGTGELVIILIVVLVLFGGSRLPKLARSIGQAQSEFKRGTEDSDRSKDAGDEPGSLDR